jgi:hypothetical protein
MNEDTLFTPSDFYNAAEHALANFLGTDELDQDVIEMVGDCAYQAVQVLPDWNYYNSLLQKSSTYVRADMGLEELHDYVSELEEQLEAYGLL